MASKPHHSAGTVRRERGPDSPTDGVRLDRLRSRTGTSCRMCRGRCPPQSGLSSRWAVVGRAEQPWTRSLGHVDRWGAGVMSRRSRWGHPECRRGCGRWAGGGRPGPGAARTETCVSGMRRGGWRMVRRGRGGQSGTAAWMGVAVPEMMSRPRPMGPPTAPRGRRTVNRSPSAGLCTESSSPVRDFRASATKPR